MKLESRALGGAFERARTASLAAALAVALAMGCGSSTDNPSAGPAGECATCHLPEYQATQHPMHAGVKPTTCGICHSTEAWHPSTIRHPWPLTGAHATGSCFSCHQGAPPMFRGTPKECVGCHRKDYDTSPFPGHSRFPTTCADCHSTTAWKPTVEHSLPALVFPEEPPALRSPRTGAVTPSPPIAPPVPTTRAPSWPRPQPRPKTTPIPTTTVPSWPTPPPTMTAPPRTAPPPDTVSGASRRGPSR